MSEQYPYEIQGTLDSIYRNADGMRKAGGIITAQCEGLEDYIKSLQAKLLIATQALERISSQESMTGETRSGEVVGNTYEVMTAIEALKQINGE